MPENIERNLTFPDGLYSQMGQTVLEGSGMSLVDFVEQEPLAAYQVIVDHALETARVSDALVSESVRALSEGSSHAGGNAEEKMRKQFFEYAAGKSVHVSVYVRPRPSAHDLIMKRSPEKIKMLSFVADLPSA
jgi:hypothetical protein